jgi:hypothetical protein
MSIVAGPGRRLLLPPQLAGLFPAFSAAALSLDYIAPACWVGTLVNNETQLEGLLLLPVVALILAAVTFFTIALLKRCTHCATRRSHIYSHLPLFINAVVLIVQLLYFPIIRGCLEAFNCALQCTK